MFGSGAHSSLFILNFFQLSQSQRQKNSLQPFIGTKGKNKRENSFWME
jgi:hypothetical protein